jgi:hypothetical protein
MAEKSAQTDALSTVARASLADQSIEINIKALWKIVILEIAHKAMESPWRRSADGLQKTDPPWSPIPKSTLASWPFGKPRPGMRQADEPGFALAKIRMLESRVAPKGHARRHCHMVWLRTIALTKGAAGGPAPSNGCGHISQEGWHCLPCPTGKALTAHHRLR